MEDLTLKDVLDLGTSGILLAFVIALWRRVGQLTDKMIDLLIESRSAASNVNAAAALISAQRNSQGATD